MAVRKIVNDIFFIGSIDWNRRTFDELVPLHEGTSYNSYFIKGSEKNALIDTVDPSMMHELLTHLKELGVKKLDYIVSHHSEQDHAGGIPKLLEIYPEAVVITNPKCKALLMEHLLIPENKFKTIEDRETLSLGNKTLEFIYYPWVHWPETMLTYVREDKFLFTCDFFGSHVADSRVMIEKGMESEVYEGAFRYFSEIMYPFRENIAANFKKVEELQLEWIAPSHGPVHCNPAFMIDCYREWISPKLANKVVIPYISMHGSTETMVHYLTDVLVSKGIEVWPMKLSVTDVGFMAMQITDAATVVVGTPQVLGGMHPQVAYAVYLYNLLRPKTKFVSIIGSFGWGGKMLDQIQSMLYNLKAEIIPPVVAKGFPKEADFKALDALANTIEERHKGLGLAG